MSTFQIDEEIDKAVDKFAEQLREKLKKLVVRDEKHVLKQYMASQKETARMSRVASKAAEPVSRAKAKAPQRQRKGTQAAKRTTGRRAPQREKEYEYYSDSGYSS